MSPDPRLVLAQAANLHRTGQIEAAIEGFRQAARLQPSWPDPHRMLAMALLQAGRVKESVQSARAALNLVPNDPHGHLLLGMSLMAAGQADKALHAFDRALRIAPRLNEAQFQAGNALMIQGRFDEAVTRFTRVLESDPIAVEARANRAVALARLKRSQEALADLDYLIGLQPWAPMHHLNKGALLLGQGDAAGAEAAVAAAEKVLELSPGHADALALRGQARFLAGDAASARADYEQAVAAAPERVEIRAMLAQILRRQEAFEEARATADAALALDPKSINALYERAEARRALYDAEGALADLDRVLALDARHADAFVSRSIALQDLNRPHEARVAIDRAVRAAPSHPDALFHYGMDELARGHWVRGWEGYEARGRRAPPSYAALPFTRWDGTSPTDTLVVQSEQGYGDAIQFVRLLPSLADLGHKVRLLAPAPLVPLFSNLDSRIEVVSDLRDLDLTHPGLRWVPLGSLPHLIARDPTTWPAAPYLHPDPERVRQWRHVREQGDFLVGITWQGSTRRVLDLGRSAPLAAFAPLAEIAGVRLVAIQRGAGSEQLDQVSFGGRILRLDDDFDADGAFLDSAALVQALDLVVTTDTSMAHLCGALARPGLVVLRAVPDWRWGRSGSSSVLYPSLELVRQTHAGEWEDVFARVADRIRDQMATPASSPREDMR